MIGGLFGVRFSFLDTKKELLLFATAPAYFVDELWKGIRKI